MTKQFRVHVRKPDGTEIVEQRRVMNMPEMPEEKAQEYVRKLWAKQYPGETYDQIEDTTTNRTSPAPGLLPSGVILQ